MTSNNKFTKILFYIEQGKDDWPPEDSVESLWAIEFPGGGYQIENVPVFVPKSLLSFSRMNLIRSTHVLSSNKKGVNGKARITLQLWLLTSHPQRISKICASFLGLARGRASGCINFRAYLTSMPTEGGERSEQFPLEFLDLFR